MRIVPSQVVAFILKAFPFDRQLAQLYPTMKPPEGLPKLKEAVLDMSWRAQTAALLDLLAAVPGELLILAPDAQAEFVISTSIIRDKIQEWDQNRLDARLRPTEVLGNENPVHALYRLLKACPDEAPETTTPDLQFVADVEFRASLRLDISGAHRALSHGEWKGATVLAGSVIEALLLWAIQARPPADSKTIFERAGAIYDAREKADGNASPSFGKYEPSPTRWSFAQLIGVAEQVALITKHTAKAANLTRGYRNLIHSGAAERKAVVCGIDTAHSALGALQATIRDLTKNLGATAP